MTIVAALASCTVLGLQHGVDWDHVAAISDVTSVQPSAREATRCGLLYAVGHAVTVGLLGIAAIALRHEVPGSVSLWMQRVVGFTLALLGAYVFSTLFSRHAPVSRGQAILAIIGRLHRHHGQEPRDADRRYGPKSSPSLGVLHGVGAKTDPTLNAGNRDEHGRAANGALALLVFASAMFVSNMALTTAATSVFAGLLALAADSAPAQSLQDISRQIAELMSQGASGKAHERYVHAKGIVCQGTFQASPGAKAISRAPHLQGSSVNVKIRFSDGAPDIAVADNSPDASPRGMAIRFATGPGTDIMAFSHNGFLVGTPEEFLELQKAISATDSTKPHPRPIEEFLGTHPSARKFVQDPKPVPVSFVTESFYANNAFVFINAKGEKRAGRYQIVPVEGNQYLDDAAAKAKSANFLRDELGPRLEQIPAKFRLILQLASPGDRTDDSTMVWPDDRKKVELGVITITSVVPDSTAAERELAFDPTHLIDGIELSDDPLPRLRSMVYVYSVAGRQSK